jgi:hypothetical protein
MMFAPMSLMFDFVGIGNGHTAEQNRFAVRVNEFIALHPNSRKLVCLRTMEGPAVGAIVPPLMVVIRLGGLLGIRVLKPEQCDADAGEESECGFHFG